MLILASNLFTILQLYNLAHPGLAIVNTFFCGFLSDLKKTKSTIHSDGFTQKFYKSTKFIIDDEWSFYQYLKKSGDKKLLFKLVQACAFSRANKFYTAELKWAYKVYYSQCYKCTKMSKLVSREAIGFKTCVTDNPRFQAPLPLYPEPDMVDAEVDKVKVKLLINRLRRSTRRFMPLGPVTRPRATVSFERCSTSTLDSPS